MNIDLPMSLIVVCTTLFFFTCSAGNCTSKLANAKAKNHTQSEQYDTDVLDWTQGKYARLKSKTGQETSSYLNISPIPDKPAQKLGTTPEKTESMTASQNPSNSLKVGQSKLEEEINDLDQMVKLIKTETNTVDLKSVGDLIISLRRKVTDHPQDGDLRIRLGTYLYIAGDYEGAAGELKHALAIKPLDLTAHTLLARVLSEAGEHEASTFEFKRAISIAPGAATVHALYAESLANRGDVSEAMNEFRRSVGIKPSAFALCGLADTLILAGDLDGAVKAARKAVSLEPNSAQAHVSLTKALLVTGDSESASRTAREAVLLNPNLAESHIAVGRTLFAANKIESAIEEFKQAVTLDPLNAEARNDLGYALYARGEILNAVNEFRLSLRINPRSVEARNNLEIAVFGVTGAKAKQSAH